MLVLLISNGEKDKAFYAERLSFLVSSKEIIEVRSIAEAKKFIYTQLVLAGKRVDLVITNFEFSNDLLSAIDLMIWLKSNEEESYYHSSLLLRSLPIVLLQTRPSTTATDRLLGFDRIISSVDLDNYKRIQYVIESAIKSWVDSLLSDYHLSRLDPRVPFLHGPIVWDSRCEVLAQGYASSPRRLPFLVFQRDFDAVEAAIDNFYKTVERISRSPKFKQEKEYHQLLINNPDFVLGETYDKFYYERNFKLIGQRKNYEPDFIRRDKFFGFNNSANLLEIKLPNDKFTAGKDFHPNLSARLFHELAQVKDYQRYFLDMNNHNTIKKQLGYVPEMTHSLLLGRSSERDIHLELIETRLRDFGSSDIALITYDELIKQREELLIRSKLYYIY
jgi:hypothetical protein